MLKFYKRSFISPRVILGDRSSRWFVSDLKGFVPRVIVTDKLKSDEAANKQMMPSVQHREHKGLNNSIRGRFHSESHQLSAKRYREQVCQRFEEW